MIKTILTYIATTLIGLVIGFFVSKVKKVIKHEKSESNALKILLQSNLTNTYFVYEQIGKIPDYIYRNWLNELSAYEDLDGDDYIHILADKMKNWEIIKTDILK